MPATGQIQQKLQQAVISRGYYKGKGKGSGTGGKGKGKGSGKGKGKTKGPSLPELKKVTCSACGEKGHWAGDSECKGKSTKDALLSQTAAPDNAAEDNDWLQPAPRAMMPHSAHVLALMSSMCTRL